MKLIALLSWYDERPDWLAGVVASLTKIQCEHVVALDGAYQLYPNGMASSAPEQAGAIMQTCASLSMGCTVGFPQDVWFGNEVEKRNHHFRLAESIAEEGDWYFTIDADTFVLEGGVFRDRLQEADEDVGEVRFTERAGGIQTGGMLRCLHRAIPGLRYVNNHFSPTTPDGTNLHPTTTPSVYLPMIVVEHRTMQRDPYRKQSQNDYYERRDRHGVEKEFSLAA